MSSFLEFSSFLELSSFLGLNALRTEVHMAPDNDADGNRVTVM